MSRISFGTGGWRATQDHFTDENVRRVGQGIAAYLTEKQGVTPSENTVAVGYDARATSADAAASLADVFSSAGFDVLLTDRDLPTPVVAHSVVDRDLAGAAMVTASHNPPEYNGVKFVPGDAKSAMPSITDAIESHIAPPDPLPETQHGTVSRYNPVEAHATHAVGLTNRYLGTDLSDLTVVYDAIHGSGRGITDALLESAGATVIRHRCDRDPTFGGNAPEPGPETLADLPSIIAEHDADLAIANDGDADRITVCTPDRGVLSGNLLFAVLYEALLADAEVTGPAIRTVSTTFLIDRIASEYGADVHEVPVGFKWIADGMATYNGLFGGEESGGFTIDGHIGTKDGVLVALLAAAAAATESIDDRLDRLFATYGEIHADKVSVDCPDNRKDAVIAGLEAALPDTVADQPVVDTVTLDGYKLLLEDGSWILVRPSGTEPKMRVYAETPAGEQLESLLDAGQELVEAQLV
ncbi:phosphoglucomutase [Natrialba sp. SSL1]|uniref:phosphoglucomutase n=1 Tax=Natrialba sp. SSL1 TaxID=1869245 RepID=UPI0008F85124|nr:phosphoglucomutase [Natrialba sp. SSL1]OIB59013.1 phosphoglucomutase [Natrialba sp. SSL1]